MSEEWGPWIEHDGSGCPCVGMYVQAEMNLPLRSGGKIREGVVVGGPCWFWVFGRIVTRRLSCGTIFRIGRVLRYRIRKPRGLAMLERLITDLPEPVGPKVDA